MRCSCLLSLSPSTRCTSHHLYHDRAVLRSPTWASSSSSGTSATYRGPFVFSPYIRPFPVAPYGTTCDLFAPSRSCGGALREGALPRSTSRVPRVVCHRTYGGIVASLFQTTVGGLLRGTIPDGVDSKPLPVNHNVARTNSECAGRNNCSAHSIYTPCGQMSTGGDKFVTPIAALNVLALTRRCGDYTQSLTVEPCMEEQEKAKQRSPNYPTFGLGTAIQRADDLYKREGKAAITPLSAVKAWGYNSLNGRSLRVLAALRQYGLLEDVGNKTVKLSQDALIILRAPADSPQHRAAIVEAAKRPAIFAQLFEQYGEDIPSDDAMVSHLEIHSLYSEEAARKLIASFRDTLGLVEQAKGPDTSRGEHNTPGVQGLASLFGDMLDKRNKDGPGETPKDQGGRMQGVQTPGASAPYDLTLALLGGEHAYLRIPRQMTKANYELLTNLIDANLKAMKAALVSDVAPSVPDKDA